MRPQQLSRSWLVGAAGVHTGTPGEEWENLGGYPYPVSSIVRSRIGLLVGTSAGVWLVEQQKARWRQLHDETVTEVLDVCEIHGRGSGRELCVAFPYGVATAEPFRSAPLRWTWRSHGLEVNERFSSRLLSPWEPGAPLVVGCESGVLCVDPSDWKWRRTSLTGRPCRALARWQHRLWAGTDDGGVWHSEDGVHWTRAGRGLDRAAVFCLAADGDTLLAGTAEGLAVFTGGSHWRRVGPRLRITAAAAREGTIAVGASPGGFWHSRDGGQSWASTPGFASVRAISAPERGT